MKTRLAPLLVVHTLLAAHAAAEPCVGPAYDLPFPGATNVSMHQADVPAAQFPGIWQDGMIDGQFYQIFANRLAVLQADSTAPAWSIDVNCQQRPCTIMVVGSPPAAALTTSKKLEQCLVPPEIKTAAAPADPNKAPPAKALSKPTPAKPASAEPAPAKPAEAAPSKPAEAAPAPDRPAPVKPAEAAPPPAKPAPAKPAQATPAPVKPAPDNPAQVAPAPATAVPAKAAPATHVPKVGPAGLENRAPEKELAAKTAAAANPATAAGAGSGNVPLAVMPADAPLEPKATDVQKPGPSGQSAAGTALTCPPPQSQPVLAVPVTCRPAMIPEGDPIITLQRLLVLSGAYPGKVDGHFGRQTKRAIQEVLGYRGRDLDIPEAIDALDAFLCDQKH